MDFYKNLKLVKVSDTEYEIIIKINEMFSQKITLKPEQLEHLLSSYRNFK